MIDQAWNFWTVRICEHRYLDKSIAPPPPTTRRYGTPEAVLAQFVDQGNFLLVAFDAALAAWNGPGSPRVAAEALPDARGVFFSIIVLQAMAWVGALLELKPSI